MNVQELIAPVLQLSDDALAQWLLAAAQGAPCKPYIPRPDDYDSSLDVLLDYLYDAKDMKASTRVGDAAFMAFSLFLDSIGVSNALASKHGRTAADLLFLLESLPSSRDIADHAIQRLLGLLSSYPDIRSRLLLALAAKLDGGRTFQPEFAALFLPDLTDPRCTVPAYAVILRLSDTTAAEVLEIVLHTLESNGLPTRYLLFEIAKVMSRQQVSPELLWRTVGRLLGPKGLEELRQHLTRLNAVDLVKRLEAVVNDATNVHVRFDPTNTTAFHNSINSNALTRGGAIDPEELALYEVFGNILNTQEGLDDHYVYGITSLALHRGEPTFKAIGEGVGRLMSIKWSYDPRRDQADRRSVPVAALRAVIKNLDNGFWTKTRVLTDGSPVPEWFDASARRLVAAHAVRQCVRETADYEGWMMDETQFATLLESSAISSYLSELEKFFPDRRGVIRLAVSPFPEDRLFATILKAAQITSGIEFDEVYTNWAQPIAGALRPDCALVNEWGPTPALQQSTPLDSVYEHRGYYVFGTGRRPDTSIERFRAALRSGLSGYRRGEYREMLPRLEQAAGERSGAAAAPERNWTQDFENFITGKRQVYLGGSVNSRLLMALWAGATDRFSLICEPSDFKAILKKYPTNRLIIDDKFYEKIPEQKREGLRTTLLGLYREVGRFLTDMAHQAKQGDPTGCALMRHFMYQLAPKGKDHPQRTWNFVARDEDMISLILDDNDFALEPSEAQ